MRSARRSRLPLRQNRSRYRRAATLPPQRPVYSAVAHDARNRLAQLTFEHRPPWHQRKIPRPFDERVAPARHLHRTHQTPLDPLSRFRFLKWLAELLRKLSGDAQQFAALKSCEHAPAISDLSALLVRQLLRDQPLAAQ